MKRNSPEALSQFADGLVKILKKQLGQGKDIADLISIALDRYPDLELSIACHKTGERPLSARVASFLLQHDNIVSVKFGPNKVDTRLFFYTEDTNPYANRIECNLYIKPENR